MIWRRHDQAPSHAAPPRLVPDRSAGLGLTFLLALYVAAPFTLSNFWLTVLDYAGIAAIGAIGLNLLVGSTGQVSLGHAPFLGLGAYAGAVLGADAGLPLPVWLLGAAVVGAVVGGVVGPFALRLGRGYLVLLTLGLVFVGEHVFMNWDGLTGGPMGRGVVAPAWLGIDFDRLVVAGQDLSRAASWFWLVWGVVAMCTLCMANILRSRPGRALQAVRDGELPARVIGVDATRFKVQAFIVASALAAVAGSLLASFQGYVAPTDWTILLSVQYLTMIVVGGRGRLSGAVVGALFVTAIPKVIERYSDEIPGLVTSAGEEGIMTVFALNHMLFGLLIVAFLVFEPRGLVAVWEKSVRRLRRRAPGLGSVSAGGGRA
ncbi:MAG: branched-chain amino acid ABC transporter permease [Nitriliruptorales bacterium]